jgi:divalent metal cation (Fe/Co/Zn/Cd) transporter
MFALAVGKRETGARLSNPVLQTEARVTVIDGALAAVVVAGVVLNAAFGWWWADPLAALVILFGSWWADPLAAQVILFLRAARGSARLV